MKSSTLPKLTEDELQYVYDLVPATEAAIAESGLEPEEWLHIAFHHYIKTHFPEALN